MESKESNYSKENGKDLMELNNHIFTYKTYKREACSKCSSEINEHMNYCKNCGSSNNVLEDESKKENKVQLVKRESIVTGVVSVGTVFVVAIILKFIMTIALGEIGSIINPLQIMMLLNLNSVSIYSSTILGTGVINACIGIVGLLIIPVASIIIANKILLKGSEIKSLKENVLGVGLTYGFIMAVISLFASVGSNFRNLIEYGVSVSSNYNTLSTFINGFILAGTCTFISQFKSKYKNEDLYLKLFNYVIKSVAVGYIFIILILIIVTISDSSYLNEIGLYGYSSELSLVVVISQLAIYMWAFANFIPITLGYNILSPFNVLSSGLFLETKLIFLSMITISLLVFLIVGFKLKENYNKKDFKPVIIFSLMYSLFMGIISVLSKILIEGSVSFFGSESVQASINMGFPLFITLIFSLIFSFIFTFIGYKLNGTEE